MVFISELHIDEPRTMEHLAALLREFEATILSSHS